MPHDASAPTREGTCVSTRRSWRLFAAALAIALTVPRMAQPGMFGDGLMYATIARNLSLGLGSLWAPAYTETTWPAFFEHPPLGFAIEAAAFWLLGDSLVVERLFSLAIFGAHALIVMAIWRRVLSPALDWLPLLFWLLPASVSWSIVNNMLENVQALFTSASVLLLLAGATVARPAAAMACGAAAAVAMVAAVLTKGPAGLFPIAAIVLLPVIGRAHDVRERALRGDVRLPHQGERRRSFQMAMARMRGASGRLVTLAAVTLVAIALCAAALIRYEPSRAALTMYVETQLAPSLRGERGVSPPYGVTRHLTLGIAGRMAVLLAVACLLGRRGRRGRRGRGVGSRARGADVRAVDGGHLGRVSASQTWPNRSRARRAMTTRWLRARVCRRGVSSAPAAVFFFAMALAGSWPFVFSPKLSGHYLVPSVPFFALGFAALAARSVDAWLALDSRPVSEHDSVRHAVRDAACDSDRDPTRDPDRPSPASSRRTPPATGDRHGWQQRLPRTLAAILIGVSLLLPILHGPMEPRDAPLVRDLTAIDAAMPREAIIGACPHASGQPDWGLHSYVQRWFRVSLDPRGVPAGGWMLVTHGACVPPPACTPAARGVTLSLFRCVTSEKARLE